MEIIWCLLFALILLPIIIVQLVIAAIWDLISSCLQESDDDDE